MRFPLPVMAFALALSACQLAPATPSAPVTETGMRLDCPSYEGTEAVAAYAVSHIIALGEAPHGTAEAPQALYTLACFLAGQGMPVRVGLEAPYTVSAALDAYLDQPEATKDLYAASQDMWSVHDGRSSEAVLGLLRQLAALKAGGFDVSVFAFDTAPGEYTGQADWGFGLRDTLMAGHLDAAVEGYDGAVLILTGSLHARKEPFMLGAIEFAPPMAAAATVRPFLSLDMYHAGGSAWMIGDIDGKPVRGVVALNNPLSENAPEQAFVLKQAITGYDGAYYTGPVTASLPAFPAAPAS